MEQQLDLHSFLYLRQSYYGEFSPAALVFNANLQEFATRLSYISNLQTNGKLSSQEAYRQIEALWEHIESSYSALEIDPDSENNVEL